MPYVRKIISTLFSKTYSSNKEQNDLTKNFILEKDKETKNTSPYFIFEGQKLKIFPAVHPNNVIWKNIAISTFEKMIRRGSVMIITFFILF